MTFTLDTSGRVITELSEAIETYYEWGDLSPFTQGYISALFESEAYALKYPDTGPGLGAVDPRFSDLAPETLAWIIADCEAFQAKAADLLERAYAAGEYDEEQAGRDLWFTRKGHVVGFWDRTALCVGDLRGEGLGDALSALCGHGTEWPGRDAYLGDDGKVYVS